MFSFVVAAGRFPLWHVATNIALGRLDRAGPHSRRRLPDWHDFALQLGGVPPDPPLDVHTDRRRFRRQLRPASIPGQRAKQAGLEIRFVNSVGTAFSALKQIDNFDSAVARATEMKAEVVMPRHRNPPEGDGGPNHWECWLRDPDGYTVVLASPDGSAV